MAGSKPTLTKPLTKPLLPSERKTKGNYCFPNFLGDFMRKVSPRVQYESSLLSVLIILVGITVITFATIFGTELSVFIKIITAVNCAAAFIFLSSNLVTTFQQYQGYLSIMNLLHPIEVEVKEEAEVETKEKDKVKEEEDATETKEEEDLRKEAII